MEYLEKYLPKAALAGFQSPGLPFAKPCKKNTGRGLYTPESVQLKELSAKQLAVKNKIAIKQNKTEYLCSLFLIIIF